jgi:Flp pilus assembly pilin Flp
MRRLAAFWRDCEGQDLVEYTLLIAFLALSCMLLFGQGRGSIESIWRVNQNNINAASSFIER